jgi:RNA polymerase sigma-70 factor (ECF subfamily)
MTEGFNKEALPHMRVLYNYAYKNTRNKFDAEDLLQETYLRAYRFFHKYEKGTNCRAWLFRIMKNLFINGCRKINCVPGTIDYLDVENISGNAKTDYPETAYPGESIFSGLLDDELTTALNSLQDDFKTVVILCDLEGLSYEEISEFTRCPVGTVRSRLHRARRILGQRLSQYAKYKGFDVKKNYLTA